MSSQPYVCPHCFREFETLFQFNYHQREVHGGFPLSGEVACRDRIGAR